jgi:RHS repeat-associated protein
LTSYERDSETGSDYAVNRMYSAGIGRFLAADPSPGSIRPINPQSWNRYSYTTNDPINQVDLAGLDITDIPATGTAGIPAPWWVAVGVFGLGIGLLVHGMLLDTGDTDDHSDAAGQDLGPFFELQLRVTQVTACRTGSQMAARARNRGTYRRNARQSAGGSPAGGTTTRAERSHGVLKSP